MERGISRPSRRAVRLSLNWQSPALLDPPERERPGAGDTGAKFSKSDTREDTAEQTEVQVAPGGAE